MHLYLATDLTPAHPDERLGPDEDEHLRLERRPFADAVAAVDARRDRRREVDRRAALGRAAPSGLRRAEPGQRAGVDLRGRAQRDRETEVRPASARRPSCLRLWPSAKWA